MAELDDVFREFAAAFAGAFVDARPIGFPDKLRRDTLDLTLESLNPQALRWHSYPPLSRV